MASSPILWTPVRRKQAANRKEVLHFWCMGNFFFDGPPWLGIMATPHHRKQKKPKLSGARGHDGHPGGGFFIKYLNTYHYRK
jgi:hypothetical protein